MLVAGSLDDGHDGLHVCRPCAELEAVESCHFVRGRQAEFLGKGMHGLVKEVDECSHFQVQETLQTLGVGDALLLQGTREALDVGLPDYGFVEEVLDFYLPGGAGRRVEDEVGRSKQDVEVEVAAFLAFVQTFEFEWVFAKQCGKNVE